LNGCLGNNVELFPIFFFYERRRTALGWGGSTKNMEKDDKSYSPRGLRHCFVFVILVYTYITYSALLSFGPKITVGRLHLFLFVGLFFEAKSMIITTYEI
jgi:hypothetical protein